MSALPHPKAVLLDLDDTILDDSAGVEDGWARACAEAAARAPGLDSALLEASIFEVRDWYWSDAGRHLIGRLDLRAASAWIVGEALRRNGVDRPGLAHDIANYYRDLREQAACLLPGALDTLDRMRSLGLRLALVTNGGSAGQRAKIGRFGLGPFFDYICIEGEFGCGKPDPRVYLGALNALDCEPGDAWMAGDNLEWDVAAPMSLGLRGIWVDRRAAGLPPSPPVKPDRVVRSISELL